MSYDISLTDSVTGETARVSGHLMTGGTFRADYHPETGTFTPALNTYADLNITYNYARYYYEVYEDLGIRTIYGLTGFESGIKIKTIEEEVDWYEGPDPDYWKATEAEVETFLN